MPDPTGHLTAEAGNQLTEIFVINGKFDRVKCGVGRLDEDLTPGVYKIKFKLGDQVQEVMQAIWAGQKYTVSEPKSVAAAAPPVEIESVQTALDFALPDDGADFRDAPPSMKKGQRLKPPPVTQPGTSPTESTPTERTIAFARTRLADLMAPYGRLLVFCKNADPTDPTDPFEGLVFQSANGNPGLHHVGGFLARTFDLVGPVLTISAPCAGGEVCQNVYVYPGWLTQIYIVRRKLGPNQEPQHDLTCATILMWNSQRDNGKRLADARLAAAARGALAARRYAIGQDMLNELLYSKFADPMLGVLGLTLLYLGPNRDRKMLETVLNNLDTLLPGHPDVQIIRSHSKIGVVPSVDQPPMLRENWSLLLESTANNPHLVKNASSCALVGCGIAGDGAWLQWLAPPGPPEPPLLYSQSDIAKMVVGFAPLAATAQQRREIVEQYNLSAAEAAVFLALMGLVQSPDTESANQFSILDPESSALERLYPLQVIHGASDRELVNQLKMPPASIRACIGRLLQRLSQPPSQAHGVE